MFSRRLVKRHGRIWSKIACELHPKRSKQIRDRWNQHLAPGIKTGAWEPEEDSLLISLHENLGNRWTEIAKHIQGRTDNSVKNRWYDVARRKRQEPRSQNTSETYSKMVRTRKMYVPKRRLKTMPGWMKTISSLCWTCSCDSNLIDQGQGYSSSLPSLASSLYCLEGLMEYLLSLTYDETGSVKMGSSETFFSFCALASMCAALIFSAFSFS